MELCPAGVPGGLRCCWLRPLPHAATVPFPSRLSGFLEHFTPGRIVGRPSRMLSIRDAHPNNLNFLRDLLEDRPQKPGQRAIVVVQSSVSRMDYGVDTQAYPSWIGALVLCSAVRCGTVVASLSGRGAATGRSCSLLG